MKILYLDPDPDIKVERIIQKIDCEFYTFNFINHLKNIKLNFQREKGFIFFLIKYLLLCPTLITKEIILKNIKKSSYSRDLRNCIVDQIERESGELSTKQDSKYFIRRIENAPYLIKFGSSLNRKLQNQLKFEKFFFFFFF